MAKQRNVRQGYWAEFCRSHSIVSLLLCGVLVAILLLMADLTDFPSRHLFAHGAVVGWFTVGGAFLLLTLVSWKLGVLSMFRVISVNAFDAGLFAVALVSALFLVGFKLLGVFVPSVSPQAYKAIGAIIALLLSLVLLVVRVCRHIIWHKRSDNVRTNVFDLRDIASGNFAPIPGQPILVSEQAADYDLLERGHFIDQLYNAITTCNPDSGFVISLEGPWGSGKTTILNNVRDRLKEDINAQRDERRGKANKAQRTKKSDELLNACVKAPTLVLIDDFDPWSYGDAESMLYGFFDAILRETGARVSFFALRHMIDEISTTLSDRYAVGKVLQTLFRSTSQPSRVKEWVDDYLAATNQKVIVFLDNIDRAESENVVLLFKLIGNVFKLGRIIYVLSFDQERVKEIFSDKLSIDYGFVKKIIQLPIQVPPVAHKIKADVIGKSLVYLLAAYGEEPKNIHPYMPLLKCMTHTIPDLREWKRFINSGFSFALYNQFGLYPPDLLALSYIQFSCPELYQAIKAHHKYFISHDRITNMDLYKDSFQGEHFNKESKLFFDSFFADNFVHYGELLGELFPYVKRYQEKHVIHSEYGNQEERSSISSNARICSAKYFDLYFTLTSNDYLHIGQLIKSTIERINRSKDQETFDSIIGGMLDSTPPDQHQELMERMEIHLGAVKSELQFFLSRSLMKHIKKVDVTRQFMSLNAKDRMDLILALLLQRMPEHDFLTFLDDNNTNYGRVEILSSIIYWLENSREETNKERLQLVQEMHGKMCQEIVSMPIDLYSEPYYTPNNIWGVRRYFKDDASTVQQYIAEIATPNNVYRLLYDTITISIGSDTRYAISQENWNVLIGAMDVDGLLAQAPPQTKYEEFVLSVYHAYKEHQTPDRMSGTGSIVVPDQIHIVL